MRRLLLLLLWLLPLPVWAQAVEIKTSQLYEGFLLLNAVSDDGRWRMPDVAARWLPLIESEPEVRQAFQQWKGQGAYLCYYFSEWSDRNAERAALLIGENELPAGILDDPYSPKTLELLQSTPRSLAVWLDFVRRRGPLQLPDEAALKEARARAQQLSAQPWQLPLDTLLGLPRQSVLTLFITRHAGHQSFPLRGQAIGIAQADVARLGEALPHQLARKFSPSRVNQDWLKRLARADSFIERAQERVRANGESPSDEFIHAASLYAATRGGLISRKQALRRLSRLYPAAQQAGAPLATLLYAHLLEFRDYPSNYAIWLELESRRNPLQPGKLEAAYAALVRDVLGESGLQLQGNLVQVSSGAAQEAGVHVGERILAVDGFDVAALSTEEILDRLSGPAGAERSLRLSSGAAVTLRLR